MISVTTTTYGEKEGSSVHSIESIAIKVESSFLSSSIWRLRKKRSFYSIALAWPNPANSPIAKIFPSFIGIKLRVFRSPEPNGKKGKMSKPKKTNLKTRSPNRVKKSKNHNNKTYPRDCVC